MNQERKNRTLVTPTDRKEKVRKEKDKKDKRKLSSAERGSIYHRIIELIDFASLSSLSDDELYDKIVESTENMVAMNLLGEEDLQAVDLGKIKSFFVSDLGKRCIAADKLGLLEKERPFTYRMNKNGEEILVQGIIDCYFYEIGEDSEYTILLDYKSNWIDLNKPLEEEEERLRSDYKIQMEIYKKALEAAGIGEVRETYLYLLDIGHGFLI